jgi:hypothetical protein
LEPLSQSLEKLGQSVVFGRSFSVGELAEQAVEVAETVEMAAMVRVSTI